LQRPDGSYLKRPFKSTYQVAEPSVVISPTKMNVFYLAVPNPVKIEMAGVPSGNVYASIDNGTTSKQNNRYVVRPEKPGKANVYVRAEIDGKMQQMGSMEFRVRRVPSPVPELMGKSQGKIRKGMLQAADAIYADMGEDFLFDLSFEVTHFETITQDRAGYTEREESNSPRLTPAMKELMQNMQRGQRFTIENIRVKGPSGEERMLQQAMAFTVN